MLIRENPEAVIYIPQHRYRTRMGDDTSPWTDWCDITTGSADVSNAQASVDVGEMSYPTSEYRVVERADRVVRISRSPVSPAPASAEQTI